MSNDLPDDGPVPGPPIRVLLVDDHEMVVESLRRGLSREPDIDVVGVVSLGREAAPVVVTLRPDVVVLDLGLPDIDGVAATREILAVSPTTRVLMLTGGDDGYSLPAAIAAGCVGYLVKSAPFDQLVNGIRRAFRGELVLSASELGTVLGAQTENAKTEVLTQRETEILGLAAEGKVNRVIAAELGISVDTVRTHMQNILTKLEAHSRLEAVATARRRRLIP